MEENRTLFLIGFLFMVSLASFSITTVIESYQRNNRLMGECMKDHKEYECEGILR